MDAKGFQPVRKKLAEEISGAEDKPLVGQSPRMLQLLDMIRKAANFPATVLIYGETGAGKELVARAIHQRSHVSAGPFVPVHLAATPESLVESELFGHEKGAFTGADERNIGLFEQARGGVLFLDEVATIPISFQPKLLRILQEQEFRRIGGKEIIKTNFRVIAATNIDLFFMVRQGRFRQDLFYRLNVIPVVVPPLRERQEDIPPLARHFLVYYGGGEFIVTAEAMHELCRHAWPGNIRELENVIQRTLVFTQGSVIDHFIFDSPVIASLNTEASFVPREKHCWDREMLKELLERHRGAVNEIARVLRVNRRTVHRKIKEYNLSRKLFHADNHET